MKRCKACGQKFVPNRFTPYQKYCSDKCRQQHRRETHKEWYKAYRKRYYQEHRQEELARSRRWRDHNQERARQNLRNWRRTHNTAQRQEKHPANPGARHREARLDEASSMGLFLVLFVVPVSRGKL